MKKLLISLAVLTVAVSMAAQKAAVEKIVDMALNDNRTMEHLNVLSNRFGGRLVGSDAYDNAAEWAIDTSEGGEAKRAAALEENEKISVRNREISMRNRTEGTDEPLLPMSAEPCVLYRQMVDAGVLGFIQSTTVPIRTLYDKGVVKSSDFSVPRHG